MCESIVVVGAALSADVDAPTERVHSAPGARRGQSPKQPTGERAGRENTEEFRVGSHGDSGNSPVSPCLRPTARRILRVLEAVQEFHHGLLTMFSGLTGTVSSQPGDGGAEMRLRCIPELFDQRMLLEHGLHDPSLNTFSPSVNQPHFPEAALVRGTNVFRQRPTECPAGRRRGGRGCLRWGGDGSSAVRTSKRISVCGFQERSNEANSVFFVASFLGSGPSFSSVTPSHTSP